MRVEISSALLSRLTAEAVVSRAREVCGLLFGERGRIDAAMPCVNVAASPANSFEIDPAALLAAHKAMRAGGPTLIGHYHSHPGGRAEPSPRDAAAAAPDGMTWLIVAGPAITAWRAGATGLHGRFTQLELVAVS